MTKLSKQKSEKFIERVSNQLDEMKVSATQKKILLELLEMETSEYQTTERDAISRYKEIIDVVGKK